MPSPRVAPRPRLPLVLLACLTIALGLASRRFGEALPAFIALYAGDALWATLMYWCVALVRPRAGAWTLGLTALGIAYAVEVSQLYRAPWIDQVRTTRLGALALGQGFLWSDLACYAMGVLLAVAVDRALFARRSR